VAGLLINNVDDAVAALAAGGLVALPTETVYGLAALARSPEAVARIFAAKGRPADHPVIVHLPSPNDLDDWATDVPDWARTLADACWPGPLTLVLPRAADVGDYLTGGQSTVGLRVPAHPIAHQVLTQLGDALAAPSANSFGRVSPTSAQDVCRDLADKLDPARDRILDGGRCPIGVESTIVDATGESPRLLRPGSVTVETIEQVTGRHLVTEGPAVKAPGTLASHYAPKSPVLLATPATVGSVVEQSLASHPGRPLGIIGLADVTIPDLPGVSWLLRADSEVDLAHGLYSALRRADDQAMSAIIAVLPPDGGIGRAVADRLRRAAHSTPGPA
jgi:L-threonylcarbamoyladenylate synthase